MTGQVQRRTGMVQTVSGLVRPEDLGITMAHEHLFSDGRVYFSDDAGAPEGSGDPVGLANRWWLEFHHMSNRDNLVLDGVREATREVGLFRAAGGQTIVEVSTEGMRMPGHEVKLREVADATGVNIVMGVGWYTASAYPDGAADLGEDDMTDILVEQVNVGVAGTGIRAGIIGEIGVSTPFAEVERQAVRAAAAAQRRTGVPISIHPGIGDDVLLDVVATLRDAGADLEHVIIGHQDAFGYTLETRVQVAQAGCVLEFDTFGSTAVLPTANRLRSLDKPRSNDTQRLDELAFLIDAGFGKQLVVSQDVFFKDQRATYGGSGYSHIVRNVVPLMLARGFSPDVIDDLLVHNPARVLAFRPPADVS